MTAESSFFPAVPRVVYERAPLEQVICQLRFPPILKVEAQLPVDFQEQIRASFPLFARASTGPAMPAELLQLFGAPAVPTGYEFKTTDESAAISLTQDSLALTVSKYTCWEDFKGVFVPAIEALISIYRPTYINRIGLRYINKINRNLLGLQSVEWKDLLSPYVAGEFAISAWAAGAVEARRIIRVKLDQADDWLLFQHGLTEEEPVQSRSYLLDFDFYAEGNISNDATKSTIDRLNGYSGRAFQWAISGELRDALGPRQLNAV